MAVSMQTYVNYQVAFQNSGVREMSQVRDFTATQKQMQATAENGREAPSTSATLTSGSTDFLNAYTSGMNEMNQAASRLADGGANDLPRNDAGEVTGEAVRETVSAVRDMVNARNEGIRTLNDNMERGDGAEAQLARMVADPAPQRDMAEVGVTIGNDGTLSLNEERLAEALQSDSERAAGVLGGMADTIRADAEAGLETPAEQLVNNDVSELQQTRQTQREEAREDDPVRQMTQGQGGLGGNTLNHYMMAGTLLNMVV